MAHSKSKLVENIIKCLQTLAQSLNCRSVLNPYKGYPRIVGQNRIAWKIDLESRVPIHRHYTKCEERIPYNNPKILAGIELISQKTPPRSTTSISGKNLKNL